jgi:hypothetical protein
MTSIYNKPDRLATPAKAVAQTFLSAVTPTFLSAGVQPFGDWESKQLRLQTCATADKKVYATKNKAMNKIASARSQPHTRPTICKPALLQIPSYEALSLGLLIVPAGLGIGRFAKNTRSKRRHEPGG